MQASYGNRLITIHDPRISEALKKKIAARPDPISQLINLLARQAVEEYFESAEIKTHTKAPKRKPRKQQLTPRRKKERRW